MSTDLLKVKEYDNLYKNIENKAILNSDVSALQEFKNRKQFFSALSSRIEKLELVVAQLENKIKDLNIKN